VVDGKEWDQYSCSVTYSQCQGSKGLLEALAGWYQPYFLPLASIQLNWTEPEICTPPHRSRACPLPWLLVPGTAAKPGLRAYTECCSDKLRYASVTHMSRPKRRLYAAFSL